jgi:hypothetical protein
LIGLRGVGPPARFAAFPDQPLDVIHGFEQRRRQGKQGAHGNGDDGVAKRDLLVFVEGIAVALDCCRGQAGRRSWVIRLPRFSRRHHDHDKEHVDQQPDAEDDEKCSHSKTRKEYVVGSSWH